MRKLVKVLALLSIGSLSYAANGVSTAMTVSSGTFQPISMYGNADGASRQAIVVGDFTSSDTVRVDAVTGLRVSLSTSALTTSNGVKIEAGQTGIPIISSNSLTVTGTVGITANSSVNVNQVAGTSVDTNSGAKSAGTQRIVIATDQPQLTNALKVDGSGVTQPVSGTVSATQGTSPWVIGNSTTAVNVLGTVPVSGTVSASQSGTWTVQPGNTANTTAWKVDGSAVTQPVSGTVTANQGGAPWADNITQFNSQAISMSGTAGEPKISCQIDGSSNTVNATVNSGPTNVVSIASAPVAMSGNSGEMRVSCDISGSSNTVSATVNSGPTNVVSIASAPVAMSGNAGEMKVSCDISGSSNTVQATVTSGPTNIVSVASAPIAMSGNSGEATMSVDIRGSSNTITANQGTTNWVVGNSTIAVNVLGTVPISVANSTMGVQGLQANNAAALGNPIQLGVQISSASPSVSNVQLTPGNIARPIADEYGRMAIVGPRFSIASSSTSAVASSTNCAVGVGSSSTTITAPGTGNHIRIYYLEATNTSATATTIGWRDTTSGTPYGPVRYESSLTQYATFAHNLKPGFWDLPSNAAFCIYSSAAGNVLWTVEYETLPD